jgi:hypothetical protein
VSAVHVLDEQEVRAWRERSRGYRDDGTPMPRRDAGDAAKAPEIRFAFAIASAAVRSDSLPDFIAQFETAWMTIQADLASAARDPNATAALYLPEGVDPALRDLFSLPSNQIQDRLLGFRDEDGSYTPGISCLTEAEFTAVTLWLEPVEQIVPLPNHPTEIAIVLRIRTIREICAAMATPSAARKFGRRAWLKESTVERYLANSRRKLRDLFGLHPDEIAELELEDRLKDPTSDDWSCPMGHQDTDLRWTGTRWVCTVCESATVTDERRIGHIWSRLA